MWWGTENYLVESLILPAPTGSLEWPVYYIFMPHAISTLILGPFHGCEPRNLQSLQICKCFACQEMMLCFQVGAFFFLTFQALAIFLLQWKVRFSSDFLCSTKGQFLGSERPPWSLLVLLAVLVPGLRWLWAVGLLFVWWASCSVSSSWWAYLVTAAAAAALQADLGNWVLPPFQFLTTSQCGTNPGALWETKGAFRQGDCCIRFPGYNITASAPYSSISNMRE